MLTLAKIEQFVDNKTDFVKYDFCKPCRRRIDFMRYGHNIHGTIPPKLHIVSRCIIMD